MVPQIEDHETPGFGVKILKNIFELPPTRMEMKSLRFLFSTCKIHWSGSPKLDPPGANSRMMI